MTNPALRAILMQQMMNQGNQQLNPGMQPAQIPQPALHPLEAAAPNPLEAGSRMGAMNAQNSLQSLEDNSNRRNLARAMNSFFSNYAKSTAPTNLAAMSEAGGPAVNAYQQSLMEEEQLNRDYQKQLAQAKKEQNKMEFEQQKFNLMHRQKERHHAEKLALQEKRLMNKNPEKSAQMVQPESEIPVGLPEYATPFSAITDKNLKKERIKEIDERADRLNPMIKNLKNLEKMEVIIKKHPNLAGSMSRVIEAANDKNPSVWSSFASNFTGKDFTAVQELKKLTQDIAVNEIKAFKGKPTDMLKRAIMDTMPTSGNTPEAFEMVSKMLSDEYYRIAKDSRVAHAAKRHHYYVPQDISEQSQFLEGYSKKGEDIEVEAPSIDLSGLSDEELMREYQGE